MEALPVPKTCSGEFGRPQEISMSEQWVPHNPDGKKRVLVTKNLPGERWLEILAAADCRVEVCQREEVLSGDEIKKAIGEECQGAIGQLTEA